MRSRSFLAFSLVMLLAGCAALRQLADGGGGERPLMSRALDAAARGDFATAVARLENVYTRPLTDDERREALLALAALDLDPRNRAGRPSRAIARLASLLRADSTPGDADRLIAQTLYLLALEVGARPYAPAGESNALPRLGRPSLAARLFRAEARRDSLRRRLHVVEERLRMSTRRLARVDGELARIHALLKR